MKLSKFRYKLPTELIAQHPSPNRDECRLMVLNRKTGEIEHKVFKDVIDYFDERMFSFSMIQGFFLPVCMVIRRRRVQKLRFFY